jgi:hypothetical protein
VDVILYDIKKTDWATGGELWSEKKVAGSDHVRGSWVYSRKVIK